MAETYDVECGRLARHFLADDPDNACDERTDSLALAIQSAVEAWFEHQAPPDAQAAPTVVEVERNDGSRAFMPAQPRGSRLDS